MTKTVADRRLDCSLRSGWRVAAAPERENQTPLSHAGIPAHTVSGMTEPSFDRTTDTPALRDSFGGRSVPGWRCPFCGGDMLLPSDTDLAQDRDRVEVYCNKPMCDAREIVVLILRGEGAHERADVQALGAVDQGTRAEQESHASKSRRTPGATLWAASLGSPPTSGIPMGHGRSATVRGPRGPPSNHSTTDESPRPARPRPLQRCPGPPG